MDIIFYPISIIDILPQQKILLEDRFQWPNNN